ncbi:MAG TPA: MBL fold metallo-hydrolase RNA specificity domain-containing protein, partial [Candidatus Thermoplasmatota archaeon]|nr:MBL fold metallo-hydrolase RNA specificity domain-containing protein [Candidatus Thermoplasmatota archaeon]
DTKTYEADGVRHEVEAEVRKFDFSAHLGHSDILKFAKGCGPERIALIHGENREPLAEDLRKDGFKVILGKRGETVELPG